VIAFKKGFSKHSSKKGYQELIKTLFEDTFAEGTSFGGLHPEYIGEILKHILYREKFKKVNITVSLEADGYHLNIKINRKGK